MAKSFKGERLSLLSRDITINRISKGKSRPN